MSSNVLVDSNVVLDIFTNDPNWCSWSENTLSLYAQTHKLCINPIIYTEISIGFNGIEELDLAIKLCNFDVLQLPKEALFLAGKVFVNYRQNKGTKSSPLPDFFIASHAAVTKIPLITRDTKNITPYFSSINLISP